MSRSEPGTGSSARPLPGDPLGRLLTHPPHPTDRTGRDRPPAQGRDGRRLVSLDVVRGLAVAGMLLVNHSGLPEGTPAQLRHSAWHGLTLADLVFPLFLFAVGVSMPFSQRADRPRAVVVRVAKLVVVGSLLVSAKYQHLSVSTGVLVASHVRCKSPDVGSARPGC